jgi:hypothetical protein
MMAGNKAEERTRQTGDDDNRKYHPHAHQQLPIIT